ETLGVGRGELVPVLHARLGMDPSVDQGAAEVVGSGSQDELGAVEADPGPGGLDMGDAAVQDQPCDRVYGPMRVRVVVATGERHRDELGEAAGLRLQRS